jgi:hypothetical protein
MCAISHIDYYTDYRKVTSFPSDHRPYLVKPTLTDPEEAVPTGFAFGKWVDAVQAKFQSRYPNVLLCVLNTDPLNDPKVREHYVGIMATLNQKRPNGPTWNEQLRAQGLLHAKISEYNQSNLFLAELVRLTVAREQDKYPVLHDRITRNVGEIVDDAHTLFYSLKIEMAKRQTGLLAETTLAMSSLQLEVQDNMPLVREYVYQLHTLSQQVLDLSGKIDKEKLLRLFRSQVARLLLKYPVLHNNIPFIAMYRSPDFDTWDKMLNFHQTLSQIVVAESARQDYTNVLQKQLSTTSGKSESTVANAVVHTKEPTRLTERNVGADQPCVVHQGSTTHTNAECSKQIDIRAKLQPDKVYQLIAALTPIVNSTLAERQRARADKNKRREQ